MRDICIYKSDFQWVCSYRNAYFLWCENSNAGFEGVKELHDIVSNFLFSSIYHDLEKRDRLKAGVYL